MAIQADTSDAKEHHWAPESTRRVATAWAWRGECTAFRSLLSRRRSRSTAALGSPRSSVPRGTVSLPCGTVRPHPRSGGYLLPQAEPEFEVAQPLAKAGPLFCAPGPGFDAPQGDPSDPQVNAPVGRSRTARKCKYRCKNGQLGYRRMRRSLQQLPANPIVGDSGNPRLRTGHRTSTGPATRSMEKCSPHSPIIFGTSGPSRCCRRLEPTRALIPDRIVRTGRKAVRHGTADSRIDPKIGDGDGDGMRGIRIPRARTLPDIADSRRGAFPAISPFAVRSAPEAEVSIERPGGLDHVAAEWSCRGGFGRPKAVLSR